MTHVDVVDHHWGQGFSELVERKPVEPDYVARDGSYREEVGPRGAHKGAPMRRQLRNGFVLLLTLVLVALTSTPAGATVSGWQRNHAAPDSTYHCNTATASPIAFASLKVCVKVSGKWWQPVAVFVNYSMGDDTLIASGMSLMYATSANPGVWYTAGDCGYLINTASGTYSNCFGATTGSPNTYVQARITMFYADDSEGDSFGVSNYYSPTVLTGS